MPQLVRVKLLAEGQYKAVVGYGGKKYEVSKSDLSNYVTRQENGGFVTYAWINNVFLNKEWNP